MATFTYTPSFPADESSNPIKRVVRLGEGYEHRIQFGLQRDAKNGVLRSLIETTQKGIIF